MRAHHDRGGDIVSSVRSIGRIAGSSWVGLAVMVALLEIVVVAGTTLAGIDEQPRPQIGAAGWALLVLAGGAFALSRRWPVGAVALALAAVVAWYGTGLPAKTSITAGLVAVLYAVVEAGRPWRTLAAGAVCIAAVVAAQAVGSHHALLDSSTLALALWLASPLAVGHLVKERRSAQARRARQVREEHAQRRVVEERLRIARELHDVVSHSISVINVQAGVAAHLMDERPEQARAALLTIKTTSREALREMRGILGVLRQLDEAEPRAPEPGVAQLGVLVETVSRANLPTRLEVGGEPWALSPAADLAAYRVVQEALTNALRHANAGSASVRVTYGTGDITIEVRDDGAGPAAGGGDDSPGGGHGLRGLGERVAAAGGELQAGPAPGGGFQVLARLPREAP